MTKLCSSQEYKISLTLQNQMSNSQQHIPYNISTVTEQF